MKIEGTALLERPPAEAFAMLLDRDVIQRCIPGCEQLEESAEGVFKACIKAGVGAIKGSFQATISLSEIRPPECYSLAIEAKSAVGHARGSAQVRLEKHASGALLSYEGEARVSGMIAAVGQRLLGAAARKFSTEFFERLSNEISSRA